MGSTLAFTMFFYGVLAPALCGAGMSAAAQRLRSLQLLWMSAAALGAVLLVYGSQFQWPPAQALDWLVLLVPLLAVPQFLPVPVQLRWLLAACLVTGFAYLMLQPALTLFSAPWLVLALVAAGWTVYAWPAPVQDAKGSAGAMVAATAALAIIVGAGGSALMAQLAGALAAALAGAVLVAVCGGHPLAMLPFRAVAFGVAVIACLYAEIGAWLVLWPLLAGVAGAPVAGRLAGPAAGRLKLEIVSFSVTLTINLPLIIWLLYQRLNRPGSYY